MKKLFTAQTAFTLIEILVVLVMMGLLMTLVFANFRSGENAKKVSLAADTAIQALTSAQTYALSGKNTNNANTNCRVPKYYYVTFTAPNLISLLARNTCDTDDTIQTYSLPSGTTIGSLSLDGIGPTSNPATMSIVFYAPFASVKGS